MSGGDQHASIHTIFMDVGGTLVGGDDFFEFIADKLGCAEDEAICVFLRERFLDLYRGESRPFRPIRELLAIVFRELAGKFGIPDQSSKAHQWYRQFFVDEVHLFSDVRPALDALQERDIRIIVLSDADIDVLMEELRKFDLEKYFDDYVISSEVGDYKPHEKFIQAAGEYCREPLDGILMVGDQPQDLATARKLGIRMAHICRGDQKPLDADFVINSLTELVDIIE